jgi:hypothetical protein
MLSKPESARNGTHNGLKFMSIRSFMLREWHLILGHGFFFR